MQHRFPSDEFPPSCSVALEAPDTWQGDPAAAFPLVLFDPDDSVGFRTNLTLQIRRVVSSMTPDVVIDDLNDQLSEEPGFELLGTETADIGGFPAILQVHTLRPRDDAEPLFQAQCLVVVPTANPGVSDLVVVQATTTASQAETAGPLFRSIMDSLTFTVGAGIYETL